MVKISTTNLLITSQRMMVNSIYFETSNLNGTVVIGDGEMLPSLRAQAEEYQILDNVWFFGACYDEKTNAELIINADMCIAPGNIGLTAMHAMMFGCPCISHNDFPLQIPEFEAIKPGKTGALFEHNNVQSLADTIQKWFMDKKDKR